MSVWFRCAIEEDTVACPIKGTVALAACTRCGDLAALRKDAGFLVCKPDLSVNVPMAIFARSRRLSGTGMRSVSHPMLFGSPPTARPVERGH